MIFPAFAGTTWHGGFGMMLKRHCPAAFASLYGGQDEARLYALRPAPGDAFPSGSSLILQLTLFGAATEHALACTQAIALLGEAGLDPAGRYTLEQASVVQPGGDSIFYTAADGLLMPPPDTQFVEWLENASPANEILVRLETPLCIKEGNAFLRKAPAYEQLLHRLFSRIDQLSHAINTAPPLPKDRRAELFAEARKIVLTEESIKWSDLSRRSGRTGQQMAFGGLIGQLRFKGNMSDTLPWLKAGQHVQIGGKTAFGLGAYAIDPVASS